MKTETLFETMTTPHITEHLDAFVIIGYSAGNHEKFVHAHTGGDAACADGLAINIGPRVHEMNLANIVDMAENWKSPRRGGRKL